jgi:hypothetical protein
MTRHDLQSPCQMRTKVCTTRAAECGGGLRGALRLKESIATPGGAGRSGGIGILQIAGRGNSHPASPVTPRAAWPGVWIDATSVVTASGCGRPDFTCPEGSGVGCLKFNGDAAGRVFLRAIGRGVCDSRYIGRSVSPVRERPESARPLLWDDRRCPMSRRCFAGWLSCCSS